MLTLCGSRVHWQLKYYFSCFTKNDHSVDQEYKLSSYTWKKQINLKFETTIVMYIKGYMTYAPGIVEYQRTRAASFTFFTTNDRCG